jgi:ABC-type uncharacterized transport system ATPase subunit
MLDDQRADGTGGARPAIELSGLTKRYRRGKGWFTAVNDVTLTVPAGQVIGLLGPNGAGKTTTIKMACGLILPTAGRSGSTATTWESGAPTRSGRSARCWKGPATCTGR